MSDVTISESTYNITITGDDGVTVGVSSITDVNAIHDNTSGEIAAITEKSSPVSGDLLIIEDSADSNNKKKLQIGNLPGGGDVTGPAGATDNAIARYDETTGKLLQNSSVFIDDSGNLGVGTASPTEIIEASGNIYLSNDNDKVILGAGKDAETYYDGTDWNFDLVNGSYIFNGASSNSKISMEAWFYRVDIGGALGDKEVASYFGSETNPRWKLGRDAVSGGVSGIAMRNGNYGDNPISDVGVGIGASGSGVRKMSFWVSDGSSLMEHLIIDSSGNVGIGTSSPAEKLEVSGNVHLLTDSDKILFGTGKDASIYYDGTDMNINPKEVGSGVLKVLGDIQLGGDIDRNDKSIRTTETAGENLVSGNVCYLKSDGKYWKIDADAEATSKGKLLIATATINADATGVFIEYGPYTTTGLTAGSTYYLSTTAGGITATAPTATGDIVRIVGYAESTTVLFFSPDASYLELA